MSALSVRRRLLHRGLRARVPLYRIPLMTNHRRLHLQWAHEHKVLQAGFAPSCLSNKSHFNLLDHDDCVRVRRYAGQHCLPECVIEQYRAEHPRLWSEVWFRIMDDPIWYELRIILIAIGTSVKCYTSKFFPSFKASPELSFNSTMHAHILRRLFQTSVLPDTCNFFLGLLIRQICDMSHIEDVLDLVSRRLAHDPHPAASKDELWLRMQAIWNSII